MQKKMTHFSIMGGKYSALLSIFILIFSSVGTAESTMGQELDPKNIFLTIQVDGKPLQQVFSVIEHQSKCKFVYDANSLNVMVPVTLDVKRESLYNILLRLSERMNLNFKQIGNYFSVRSIEKVHVAQPVASPVSLIEMDFAETKMNSYGLISELTNDIPIRGKVTDENGNPLQGVSVQLKGNTIGTMTDVNGNFKIDLQSDNAILVFSYVGFETTEIKVGNLSTVSVRLKLSVAHEIVRSRVLCRQQGIISCQN